MSVKSRLNGVRTEEIRPDLKKQLNGSRRQSESILGLIGWELKIAGFLSAFISWWCYEENNVINFVLPMGEKLMKK